MTFRLLFLFFLLATVATGEENPTEFTNSLGMRFVEIPGTQVLFSVYETRVADFSQYVEAEDRDWPRPSFDQEVTHPAVNISWEDAKNFCSWLTQLETENGSLPEGWRYRLPTEQEWMAAVMDRPFFEDEPGFNPELKFPWGETWPPPKNAGNYSPELQIEDFPKTAPVGSFLPNVYGLHDMGGNVWEWCEDFFEGARDIRVLKGGSYNMREVTDILITTKIGNVSYIRLPAYGFRVVVEKP